MLRRSGLGNRILRARRRVRLHIDGRVPDFSRAVPRPSGRRETMSRSLDIGSGHFRSVSPVFETSNTSTTNNRCPSRTRRETDRQIGHHESGICAVPCSGVVIRSAFPVPSVRCQKIAASPSRSDWNTTRWPLAVHIGKRLCPPTVNWRIDDLRARSYTQMEASLPSLMPKTMACPSGETRGYS